MAISPVTGITISFDQGAYNEWLDVQMLSQHEQVEYTTLGDIYNNLTQLLIRDDVIRDDDLTQWIVVRRKSLRTKNLRLENWWKAKEH